MNLGATESTITFNIVFLFSFSIPYHHLLAASASSSSSSSTTPELHTHHRDIKPGDVVSEVVALRPRRGGIREVMATFSSKQLVGLNGSVEIRIDEAPSTSTTTTASS